MQISWFDWRFLDVKVRNDQVRTAEGHLGPWNSNFPVYLKALHQSTIINLSRYSLSPLSFCWISFRWGALHRATTSRFCVWVGGIFPFFYNRQNLQLNFTSKIRNFTKNSLETVTGNAERSSLTGVSGKLWSCVKVDCLEGDSPIVDGGCDCEAFENECPLEPSMFDKGNVICDSQWLRSTFKASSKRSSMRAPYKEMENWFYEWILEAY